MHAALLHGRNAPKTTSLAGQPVPRNVLLPYAQPSWERNTACCLFGASVCQLWGLAPWVS